jgi:hypothetical protein
MKKRIRPLTHGIENDLGAGEGMAADDFMETQVITNHDGDITDVSVDNGIQFIGVSQGIYAVGAHEISLRANGPGNVYAEVLGRISEPRTNLVCVFPSGQGRHDDELEVVIVGVEISDAAVPISTGGFWSVGQAGGSVAHGWVS